MTGARNFDGLDLVNQAMTAKELERLRASAQRVQP